MKKELFEDLLESVKQGGKIMKGSMEPSRVYESPGSEVRKVRKKYGLSQDKFASLMGISVATLRNWEQGRRKPEGGNPVDVSQSPLILVFATEEDYEERRSSEVPEARCCNHCITIISALFPSFQWLMV